VQRFKKCTVYIFEISSIKIAKYNETHYIPANVLSIHNPYIQSEKELYDDLMLIYNLIQDISTGKKVIFIPHIRLQIISSEFPTITNREIIYETIQKFVIENSNAYIFDISNHLYKIQMIWLKMILRISRLKDIIKFKMIYLILLD
jgi:hypothetical protein